MTDQLSYAELCPMLRDIFHSFVAEGNGQMRADYKTLIDACGDNAQNYISVVDLLGGHLAGLIVAVSATQGVSYQTIVDQIFDPDYAEMLDEASRSYRNGDEADGAIPTRTSEGTDTADRVVGDGEVDGMEQDQ